MKSEINLLFFDIFSKKLGFFYKNQEKIGSYFGLILTFIYILTSLIIFIHHLIITFKRKEMRVYDTSIFAQEMPTINIDSNNLYFAFGIEDPISSNRYIDETIYYPQILFIDRVKIDGEFKTITKKSLDYERCKEENFGQNYQHLFLKGELNNSYCLKDFNYNLTFAGGYKYEKMTYIRIKIFPCKNTTENNNHCKSQEIIDSYLTSGYFSILIKNFGLNPSNYSSPILPTLQDIYTSIDKRLYRNFNINFGITEVHTDIGIINEKIKKKKYLQYRDNFQTFYFRDEKEYLDGKEICVVQLKLDDTILIQKRTYTKISDIFSRVGGYMQLIHTIFSIFSLLINKFQSELKIINSIFNFNIKEKKMGLKFKSLDFDSKNTLSSNRNLIFTSKKTLKNVDNFEPDKNNTNNKLNILDNNCNNISSVIHILDNKIKFENYNNNQINIINSKFYFKDRKSKSLQSFNFPKKNNRLEYKDSINNQISLKDDININLFDYFCNLKSSNKIRYIQLFNFGNSFYRKRMDIIHVFTLLIITEKVLLKNNQTQIYSLCKESELLYSKKK